MNKHEYFVDANQAGYHTLKIKDGDNSRVVLPLGIDEAQAVAAAIQYVNLQNNPYATLDLRGHQSLPNDVVVTLKQHRGKKLSVVLKDDIGYLVWFYRNYKHDDAGSREALWQALHTLASDSRSSFHKALSIKEVEKMEPPLSSRADQTYAGDVGDKISQPFTLKHALSIKSKYTESVLKLILKNSEGQNLLIISNCKAARLINLAAGLQLPQELIIEGEVAAHDSFKGTAQTKINKINVFSSKTLKFGVCVKFDCSEKLAFDQVIEKISSYKILEHPFILSSEFSHLTKGEPNKEKNTSNNNQSEYFAFFNLESAVLMTHNEIRELIEAVPLTNLDGLSISSLEHSMLVG